MTPDLFHFRSGDGPLLVSFPHVGIFLPEEIAQRMTDTGLQLGDTDWHVDLLYRFLEAMDVTTIAATHSRYVVDLNRDPEGGKLYPGRFETGVCPTASFHEQPLYRDGQLPGEMEIAERVARYWQPYHDRLRAELASIREAHGFALLLDAHSIISVVPELFEGRLPDLNLGTAGGASCDPVFQDAARAAFERQQRFSHVVNGRFKGGYITRHYGQPGQGVHAMQLEMAMSGYLDESQPDEFDEARAQPLQSFLKSFVDALLETACNFAHR